MPSSELSEAAQQIGKYIVCINRIAEEWEKKPPQKIKNAIPEGFELKAINPVGILIVGDASKFTSTQKKDFELIKRQYKHVAE